MTEKAEVKKIVLDLGDKEIDLTPYQAKMLARILGEMFVTQAQAYPVYVDRPWIWPSDRPYRYDYIWCGSVAGQANFSSSDGVVTLGLTMPDQSLWADSKCDAFPENTNGDGLPQNVSGDCYHADL